jgi:NAD(P)-dependent dehydrogenase (short-subunit alcohol dehydrogenase family)
MTDLTGQTVVVTGGNRGLGLALAQGVGLAGAAVCLWARDEQRNRQAVDELCAAGVDASSVVCDTADEAAVEHALSRTLDWHGAIDCLMANAGVADDRPLIDTSLEDWRRVLSTNLDGTFLCTRTAARYFVRAGRPGAMVVVSSMVAHYGAARQIAYTTTKNGLIGLGRTLAVELARYSVRVNILLPGWTVTPMNETLRENQRFVAAVTARTPVRRWGEAGDFHEVAAFLADPRLTFHTGNEVVVDGGYTIF